MEVADITLNNCSNINACISVKDQNNYDRTLCAAVKQTEAFLGQPATHDLKCPNTTLSKWRHINGSKEKPCEDIENHFSLGWDNESLTHMGECKGLDDTGLMITF